MTPHMNAEKANISDIVIMPGDPLRAKYIAENFLQDITLVNNVRLALAYTGYYEGRKITVMSSGMGMPSIGIYAYELFNEYGVKKIIRLGSCGSYSTEIKLRDIILVEKAYTLSNFALQFTGEDTHLVKSSVLLGQSIVNSANKNNISIKIGNINTSDIFYNKYQDEKIKENYCLGVEMECFALFYVAKLLGRDATAVLTVSDNLVTKEKLTSEERETSFNDAIKLVLEAVKK